MMNIKLILQSKIKVLLVHNQIWRVLYTHHKLQKNGATNLTKYQTMP